MDDASAGSVTVAERNLNLPPDVNLVSAPDLFSTRCADVIREYYRNGTKCSFPRLVRWLEIDPYLADILLDHTSSLSDDESVITFLKVSDSTNTSATEILSNQLVIFPQ